MDGYLDYIKRGEILLSPSFKFILRCSECRKWYTALELFIRHCVDNHNEGGREPTLLINERRHHDRGIDDVGSSMGIVKCKDIGNETEEELDPLTIVKQEHISEHEEISAEDDSESAENIESGDETLESGNNKTFVRNFIKSEQKVTTLISAYKNQPLLWNTNLSFQIRAKDRPKYLQEIATAIKEQINIQITVNQVAAVISRLRREYRFKVNRIVTKEKIGASHRKSILPMSFLQQLNFLKPFVEINSLTYFDSLNPELVPQQVMQILEIYKRIPFLWNTDLIENVCTNKRLEALEEMQSIIESEMGLKTTQNSLKKYIYSIHIHFGREKRRNMVNGSTTEDICKYYQHMIFLFDHVAPFKCSQCDREFQSPLVQKIHNSEHDGLRSLTCSLCNKEYKSAEAYTFHAKRHMNDLKEECDECGKKFMRLADLNIHKRSHTGDTPYCCEMCGSSFRYSQELTTHRRRHKKQYIHKCSVCSKGFYEKEQMKAHMKSHTNIRDFECKTCGKAFKLRKTLKQHEFTHEEGRKHLCTLCGKTFKNKIGLSHHMRTHRRKVEIVESDLSSISIFNTQ